MYIFLKIIVKENKEFYKKKLKGDMGKSNFIFISIL